MLNINFSLLDESINISGGTFIALEHVDLFASIVKNLYQYDEGSAIKLFDKNYHTMKATEMLLVTDILSYNVNTPSVLKMVYKDLEDQLNDNVELKTKLEELVFELSDIINDELLNHELDLEKEYPVFPELFKFLGVKIEYPDVTIFDKAIMIVQIFKYLSKKKLLVFVNVCSYFTCDELIELTNYINLCQLDVLFIEPRRVTGVGQYVVDSDFYVQFE